MLTLTSNSYPGKPFPKNLGIKDLANLDILSLHINKIIDGKLTKLYLPMELWIKIYYYKYYIEINEWDEWIYSDDNCLTTRRYNLRRSKKRIANPPYNPFYATNLSYPISNYASDVMNTMNTILRYHKVVKCNNKSNYLPSILNIFEILQKYGTWLWRVPNKYRSLLKAFTTLLDKIYEYKEVCDRGELFVCCEHHNKQIRKYLHDCHYFVDKYCHCEYYNEDCSMCWDFHEYIYHNESWRLNKRVLRNGKIIHKDPNYDYYLNIHFSIEDIL
tara:strand:+ start:120 stop:938 length:819 start_codon:yes stop_codon:yes gene_type:complete